MFWAEVCFYRFVMDAEVILIILVLPEGQNCYIFCLKFIRYIPSNTSKNLLMTFFKCTQSGALF